MIMKKTPHPFYCHKKNCRKTVWETPEYLSKEDWDFAKEVVKYLSMKSDEGRTKLYDFLWDRKNLKLTKDFFNHTIGWPEGFVYCQDSVYFGVTAYPGWLIHTLEKLIKAVECA